LPGETLVLLVRAGVIELVICSLSKLNGHRVDEIELLGTSLGGSLTDKGIRIGDGGRIIERVGVLVHDKLAGDGLRDGRDPTKFKTSEPVSFPKWGQLGKSGTGISGGTDAVGKQDPIGSGGDVNSGFNREGPKEITSSLKEFLINHGPADGATIAQTISVGLEGFVCV
jgi:hypothetical protein